MTSTQKLSRASLWTLPGVLAVAILLGAALAFWLEPPRWGAIGLGAAGWLVALMLRGPIAAAVSRLPQQRAMAIVTAASGPCEEIVRLLLVLWLISGFPDALWAGYGWAAIEIVYTMVNALVIRSLLGKTDEKSLEARRMLESQGLLRTDVPLWAALERTSASLLHIGFTLLLVWQPWMVLVTMPVHSLVNLMVVRLTRISLPMTEAVLAVIGVTAFAVALACQ